MISGGSSKTKKVNGNRESMMKRLSRLRKLACAALMASVATAVARAGESG